MSTDIPINRIRRDGGTQIRAELDAERVEQYRVDMLNGDKFPPVEATYDGTFYWLTDGFHRVAAAEKLGRDTFEVTIVQGTQSDAQWTSYAANNKNGKGLTREDLIRAIDGVLQHQRGTNMSDHAIALYLKTTQRALIADRRRALIATGKIYQSETRTGADGREMKTANIGKQPHWSTRRESEFWGLAKKYGLHNMIPERVINAIQAGASTLDQLDMSYEQAAQLLNAAAVQHWQATFPAGSYIRHRNADRIARVVDHRAELLNVFDEHFDRPDSWQVGPHLEPSTPEANEKYKTRSASAAKPSPGPARLTTPPESPLAEPAKQPTEKFWGPLAELAKTHLAALVAVRDQAVEDPRPESVWAALLEKGLIALKSKGFIVKSLIARDYMLTSVAFDAFQKSELRDQTADFFQVGDHVDYFYIDTNKNPWVTVSQKGRVAKIHESRITINWDMWVNPSHVEPQNCRLIERAQQQQAAPVEQPAERPAFIKEGFAVVDGDQLVLILSVTPKLAPKSTHVYCQERSTVKIDKQIAYLSSPIGRKAQVDGKGSVGEITAVDFDRICINRPNPNASTRMTHWIGWTRINLVSGDVQQPPLAEAFEIGNQVVTRTGRTGTVINTNGLITVQDHGSNARTQHTSKTLRLMRPEEGYPTWRRPELWNTSVRHIASGQTAEIYSRDNLRVCVRIDGKYVWWGVDEVERIDEVDPEPVPEFDQPVDADPVTSREQAIESLWWDVQGIQAVLQKLIAEGEDNNLEIAAMSLATVRHHLDIAVGVKEPA